MAKTRTVYDPSQNLAITVDANGRVTKVEAYRVVGVGGLRGALTAPFDGEKEIKTYPLAKDQLDRVIGQDGPPGGPQTPVTLRDYAQRQFDAKQVISDPHIYGQTPVESMGPRLASGSLSQQGTTPQMQKIADYEAMLKGQPPTQPDRYGNAVIARGRVYNNRPDLYTPEDLNRTNPYSGNRIMPSDLSGTWNWNQYKITTDAQGKVTDVRGKNGLVVTKDPEALKRQAQDYLANDSWKFNEKGGYSAQKVAPVTPGADTTPQGPTGMSVDQMIVNAASGKGGLQTAVNADEVARLKQNVIQQKGGQDLLGQDKFTANQNSQDAKVARALANLFTTDQIAAMQGDPAMLDYMRANGMPIPAGYDTTDPMTKIRENAQGVLRDLRGLGVDVAQSPRIASVLKQRGVDVTKPAEVVSAIPDLYPNTTKYFMEKGGGNQILQEKGALAVLAAAKDFLDQAQNGPGNPSRDTLEQNAAELLANPNGNNSNYRTGGGYSRPAFDTQPYEDLKARVGLAADAQSPIIAQAGTELANRLAQTNTEYQNNINALKTDLAKMQAGQGATNAQTAAATQQDLAQQGVNPAVLAAQQSTQEKMRQDAAQRQQDYVNKVAQAAAQNTADSTKTAQNMTSGLQNQLNTAKSLTAQQIDAQMAKDQAQYNAASRGGGGGGGGSSSDMTASQLYGLFQGENNLANAMDPNNNLNKWYQGYADTLYGPQQAPALDYLKAMVGALQSNNFDRFGEYRSGIGSANLGSDANYNRQVLQQAAQEALQNYRKDQAQNAQWQTFNRRYGRG